MQPQPYDIRDRQRFYFHATPLRRSIIFLLAWIMRLFMKLEVTGLENLPPEGAVIVAANHVTNFDVFPMQLSLPRPIFFMGKAELFRVPLLEAVFRNMGAFPVHRGEKDDWAMPPGFWSMGKLWGCSLKEPAPKVADCRSRRPVRRGWRSRLAAPSCRWPSPALTSSSSAFFAARMSASTCFPRSWRAPARPLSR